MPWRPDYLSLPQGKHFLRVTSTKDDSRIARLITAASRAVDESCHRQFGRDDVSRTRTYRRPATAMLDGSGYMVKIDDVHDATGIVVTADGLAVADATLWPEDAPLEGRPYTGLVFPSSPVSPVRVTTDKWGWDAVPSQVPTAVEMQLNRWFTRADSPYGVAGSPSEGSEVRLSSRLDPDVVVVLRGLRRKRRPA